MSIRAIDRLTVRFETPTPETAVGFSDVVELKASAADPAGISTITLLAGTAEVGRCDFDASLAQFVCAARMTPSGFAGNLTPSGDIGAPVVPAGTLTLTAVAVSTRGVTDQVSIPLVVLPPPTAVVIEKPLTGTTVNTRQLVSFEAKAANISGIAALILSVGSDFLAQCDGIPAGPGQATCTAQFNVSDHLSAVTALKLPLTAKAIDRFGNVIVRRVELPIDLAGLEPGVTITAPLNGSTLTTEFSSLSALAVSPAGLKSVSLLAGTVALGTCLASDPQAIALRCSLPFRATDVFDQVIGDKLTLTANAVDGTGHALTTSVTVSIEGPGVSFVKPVVTTPIPPVASVGVSGPLELAVSGAVVMQTVTVTDEVGTVLQAFSLAPYVATVPWMKLLTRGPHTLTATAVDKGGRKATAKLAIQVECPVVSSNQTDKFVEPSTTKVDLLWVIDNSSSMGNKQATLAANAQRFMTEAMKSTVDFHIAVTSTGLTSVSARAACPGGAGGGEAGRFFPVDNSRPRILSANTPHLADVFAANAKVGTCHSIEAGLEAARLALTPPLIDSAKDPNTSEPNDGNAGFLRADARLSIIWVTDADDTETFPVRSVQDYVNQFRAIKPGHPELLSVSAVIGRPNSTSCSPEDIGARYAQLVTILGGQIADICASDWGALIDNLAHAAFQPTQSFGLSSPADANTVIVLVDGVPVPATSPDGTAHWHIDPAAGPNGSVVFDPGSVPGPNSRIDVTYAQVCQ